MGKSAAALLVGIGVLSGCGDQAAIRIEGHRAFQHTEHAVTALSLARSREGGLLASWVESSAAGDDLRWAPPGDEGAPVHIAELGADPQAWLVSPLVSVGAGFARFGLGPTEFGELRVAADGTTERYERVFVLAGTDPHFGAVGVGDQALLLVLDLQGTQLWRRDLTDWHPVGVVTGPPCLALPAYEIVPFAVAPYGEDELVLLSEEFQSGGRSCHAVLRVTNAQREPMDEWPVTGATNDPESGTVSWFVGGVAALPSGAIGVLWLGLDGGIRVDAMPQPGTMDLDAPLFDADGEVVADARIFASDNRFVVTWRVDRDAELGTTRAVVIDPSNRDVSAPTDWPLDEARCADAATVPRDKGVDYVCLSRCQGAGCRENWLYRGRVFLR